MARKEKHAIRFALKRLGPISPAILLLLLLAGVWLIVEVWLVGIGYTTRTKGYFERKYADVEEQVWTEPMPLLVTYRRKEIEVEHVVGKWSFEVTYGGLKESGWTKYEFREPTAEEAEDSPALRRTGESITIFFPIEPERMKVYRWKAGEEAEKTELTLENGELFLAPGKWTYGVEASWPTTKVGKGYWGGQAWYCFRATGPSAK